MALLTFFVGFQLAVSIDPVYSISIEQLDIRFSMRAINKESAGNEMQFLQ